MKKMWIITLLPEFFTPFLGLGVIGAALRGERGKKVEVELVPLSEYSPKSFKGVDGAPFGGGGGMVMRADVLKNALLKGVVEAGGYGGDYKKKLHVIYPGPKGKTWNNDVCKSLAKKLWSQESSSEKAQAMSKDMVFICGRYEGIDQRFIDLYIDQEISLGDYILTGGEIPTMAIIDSLLRFNPGVLGNKNGHEEESFQNDLLEHPQYTRPREFDGVEVPSVLLSGDHEKIRKYQKREKLRVTELYRPDLLEKMKKKEHE